jgi:hypothetical protein
MDEQLGELAELVGQLEELMQHTTSQRDKAVSKQQEVRGAMRQLFEEGDIFQLETINSFFADENVSGSSLKETKLMQRVKSAKQQFQHIEGMDKECEDARARNQQLQKDIARQKGEQQQLQSLISQHKVATKRAAAPQSGNRGPSLRRPSSGPALSPLYAVKEPTTNDLTSFEVEEGASPVASLASPISDSERDSGGAPLASPLSDSGGASQLDALDSKLIVKWKSSKTYTEETLTAIFEEIGPVESMHVKAGKGYVNDKEY